MIRKVRVSKNFKKQYKRCKSDSNWTDVFEAKLSKEIDEKERTPWEFISSRLVENKVIPSYFKPHPLNNVTKQSIKQIKRMLGSSSKSKVKVIDIHLNGQAGDHLLIYSESTEIVYLLGIGTHSELF